jgi:hypothetical protein
MKMKRLFAGGLFVLVFATFVFAEWQVNFEDTYMKKGIDQAVIDALKEGVKPDDIVDKGLDLEGLNPQNLVMALYCAGVKGQDVREAAASHNISELIVAAGYKKSLEECAGAVADSQAYTPVSAGFSGGLSAGSGSASFASPSTFRR